jgi:hypothetical protein
VVIKKVTIDAKAAPAVTLDMAKPERKGNRVQPNEVEVDEGECWRCTQCDWQMCEKCMVKDNTKVPVGPVIDVFTHRCRAGHLLRAFARASVDEDTLDRGCGKCFAPLRLETRLVMDPQEANDPVYSCFQCHDHARGPRHVDWYCSKCYNSSTDGDPITLRDIRVDDLQLNTLEQV